MLVQLKWYYLQLLNCLLETLFPLYIKAASVVTSTQSMNIWKCCCFCWDNILNYFDILDPFPFQLEYLFSFPPIPNRSDECNTKKSLYLWVNVDNVIHLKSDFHHMGLKMNIICWEWQGMKVSLLIIAFPLTAKWHNTADPLSMHDLINVVDSMDAPIVQFCNRV